MISFNPKALSVGRLHAYLLSAVAPRPIAFASTIDAEGNPNLSPFSFFNVFSANPPILIFSPARRVSDNTTKDTFQNVEATKEVVINVVNHAIVQQMSLSSTEYPKSVNEFEKVGLTMLPSEKIRPFRVAESPIQLECNVNDIVKLGTEGGAGNLIICEVVKLHISKHVMNEDNTINQNALDLVARAGGNFYSRVNKGFFEIPKPLKTIGIGVDALPDFIKNSSVLTGNNLGMLANVEVLPCKNEIVEFKKAHPNIETLTIDEKHKLAQNYLDKEHVKSAWKLLLS